MDKSKNKAFVNYQADLPLGIVDHAKNLAFKEMEIGEKKLVIYKSQGINVFIFKTENEVIIEKTDIPVLTINDVSIRAEL